MGERERERVLERKRESGGYRESEGRVRERERGGYRECEGRVCDR